MDRFKKQILLVEDDVNLGSILRDFLNVKGYDVELALNGTDGYHLFKKKRFDLLILDVMMPQKDGFTLASEIRKIDKQTPIIFLTAKSLVEDRIKGLKIGGDDYLTKPFSSEELLLRIKNILKRIRIPEDKKVEIDSFKIGRYRFDYSKRILSFNCDNKRLTSKESELLRLLAINQNGLVDRTTALKEIWKNDSYFTSRSMDVYIAKLRSYLKNDKSVQILNVHGTGFKLLTC